MHASMYICIVCMHACMHVCMYVCMYVCIHIRTVCPMMVTFLFFIDAMFVWPGPRVCMYGMYVCMYSYTCTHAYRDGEKARIAARVQKLL
jgi:hypothetical protein